MPGECPIRSGPETPLRALYEELGWCYCGQPLSALAVVRDYLQIIDAQPPYDEHRQRMDAIGALGGVEYLLAYVFDRYGWTEHGSALPFGWLTDEGKRILRVLRQYNLDDEAEPDLLEDWRYDLFTRPKDSR